ncbi:MAG: 1-acyl-sn-glycerol-3-phosphate acyltransferase [Niabella sp.]
MKRIKAIVARILAVWGLLTFAVTFLIIFLPSMLAYLLPDPKGTSYLLFWGKLWIRSWYFLIGCPVEVKGKGNFKKGETYIVTCNHNSLLDPTISSPFIPGPNKTIAKVSFAKVPIFGWYYARGSVLVDRKNAQSRRKSVADMRHVLDTGMHMCIYPEGTRNRTNEPLKPFYDGAFKLAEETGKSIMPAVILNTRLAVPLDKTFYFWPQRLGIHFLPPISPANKTAAQLKEEVFEAMKKYIQDYYRH